MSFCDTCNEWYFDSGVLPHECPPLWIVWCPDEYGETLEDNECRPIRARDAEQAAEAWAERSDREGADYTIVRGSSVTVCVVPADDPSATPTRWFVEGESVPHYFVCEVKGEDT